AAEMFAAIDEFARYDAFGENAAFVINVAEKKIECGEALGQAFFDLGPFTGGDDARDEIVREDTFGAFLAAVDRESDAFLQEGKIGGLLTFAQFLGSETQKGALEGLIVPTGQILGLEHFIVSHVKPVVYERWRDEEARLCGGGHRRFGVGIWLARQRQKALIENGRVTLTRLRQVSQENDVAILV